MLPKYGIILGLSNHSMSNIALVILLDFSLLLLFLFAFPIVFTLPTIVGTIVGSAITIWEAIQKRIHEPIYKMDTKNEAKRLKTTAISHIVKNTLLIEY